MAEIYLVEVSADPTLPVLSEVYSSHCFRQSDPSVFISRIIKFQIINSHSLNDPSPLIRTFVLPTELVEEVEEKQGIRRVHREARVDK